jgi:hypothetical protein
VTANDLARMTSVLTAKMAVAEPARRSRCLARQAAEIRHRADSERLQQYYDKLVPTTAA